MNSILKRLDPVLGVERFLQEQTDRANRSRFLRFLFGERAADIPSPDSLYRQGMTAEQWFGQARETQARIFMADGHAGFEVAQQRVQHWVP